MESGVRLRAGQHLPISAPKASALSFVFFPRFVVNQAFFLGGGERPRQDWLVRKIGKAVPSLARGKLLPEKTKRMGNSRTYSPFPGEAKLGFGVPGFRKAKAKFGFLNLDPVSQKPTWALAVLMPGSPKPSWARESLPPELARAVTKA